MLHLIAKEIRASFLNLRFVVFSTIVTTLFILSTTASLGLYQSKLNSYNRLQAIEQDRLMRAKENDSLMRSHFIQYVNPPNSSCFLYDKGEAALPDLLGFRISQPERIHYSYKLDFNYAIPRHIRLDWTFLICSIMSFGSILLGYASISGEAEVGTLRLLLSNPVPRTVLLMAKYLAAMIEIVVALLLGVCGGLVIIVMKLPSLLSEAMLLRMGGWLVVSVCLLAIYLGIGLLCSARCASSHVSLYWSLAIWVCLVVIVPSGARLAAQLVYPSESRMATEYGVRSLLRDATINAGEDSSKDLANRIKASYSQEIARKISQIKLALYIGRVSPNGSAMVCVEGLLGLGVQEFENRVKIVGSLAEAVTRGGTANLIEQYLSAGIPSKDVVGLRSLMEGLLILGAIWMILVALAVHYFNRRSIG